MSLLDGIIQGIIQGLTEFLPVSSSGHVSLYQHFTGNSSENGLVFTLMLHLGTLLAVFIAYHKDIYQLILEAIAMLSDLFKGKLFKAKLTENRMMIYMIILTTLPLAGFIFIKDFITSFASDTDIIVEGLCFLFTSALLFFSARCVKGRKTAKNMKFKDAMFIGFFQGLAILPGVSRSGSTISSGLMLGFSKDFMVKFSFLLSIPAILGASVLEIPDAIKEGVSFGFEPLIAGMIAALVIGILAIKLVQYLVVNDKYIYFSYYTFILGVVVLCIGIYEKMDLFLDIYSKF